MSKDTRMDVIEAMLDEYGEAPTHGFPTNPLDYRYYMVVGMVSAGEWKENNIYYEWSNDLDELYEQAGNIIHDNIVDCPYGLLAQALAIVDSVTGNVFVPMLPSVIEFRQSSKTINV